MVRGHAPQVVRHGASDDNRSSQYDALVAASQRAESAKKRIHAPKGSKVPQHRVQNLIGNPAKARAQQSFLQREPVLKGVVEFVHGAGRVKLHLTQQNTVLNFALGGIQCPLRGTQRFDGGIRERARSDAVLVIPQSAGSFVALQRRDRIVKACKMNKNGHSPNPILETRRPWPTGTAVPVGPYLLGPTG